MTDTSVTFRTKNGKTVTLAPVEFLRRFLLHVLPDGFKKIRHSGLYAGAHVDTLLARAHCLLAPATAPRTTPASAEPWAEALRELTGRDVDRCTVCGGLVDHLPIARAPPRGAA